MISCANLSPEDIVLKKMLYLYITHYATSVPDLALLAINQVGVDPLRCGPFEGFERVSPNEWI